MHSRKDFPGIGFFSKNFITDPTTKGVVTRLNTTGIVLDSNGYGANTATSTAFVAECAGFSDQRVTLVCKYVSPTTAGNESLGAMARMRSLDATADTDYYMARCVSGQARITKFIAGVSSTLTFAAFALPQNTLVTITFTVIGSALTAVFDAGGSPATVTISAVDTAIPAGGFMGFRTTSSTGYCRSIIAEQL